MKSLAILFVTIATCLAEPNYYPYSTYSSFPHYSSLPHYSSHGPYSLGYQQTIWPSTALYSSPIIQKVIAPAVSPVVPAAVTTIVEGVKSQYQVQDIHGQTSYGHSEPGQTHNAVQDAHGNKIGSFSYVKPDGHLHKTDYVADAAGYRVASNDLPVGPVAALPVPLVHSLHKRSAYYGAPVVTPSGHLADTPEVAAAKAAHLAEHAKQGNYYAAAPSIPHGEYNPSWTGSYAAPSWTGSYAAPSWTGSYAAPSWTGSYAAPVVTPNGYLADAPDVAAAKAAHFAEHAKQGNYINGYGSSWYGAHGTPAVTPNGYLADTPEVAAAKAAHFAEKAKISSHYNAIPPTSYQYGGYAPVALTPSGHVADTPEVAHAKAAHLAEYAAIASRQKRSILGSWWATPASTVPLYKPIVQPYATPITHSFPYASYPIIKPLTSTTIVHGPHAISHTQ